MAFALMLVSIMVTCSFLYGIIAVSGDVKCPICGSDLMNIFSFYSLI